MQQIIKHEMKYQTNKLGAMKREGVEGVDGENMIMYVLAWPKIVAT